ncbi:tyrosine-type recombinase/integrase [Rhodococcus hoagii]|nr:tyrosine-type recombinase/integrase [Prescottella equi]
MRATLRGPTPRGRGRDDREDTEDSATAEAAAVHLPIRTRDGGGGACPGGSGAHRHQWNPARAGCAPVTHPCADDPRRRGYRPTPRGTRRAAGPVRRLPAPGISVVEQAGILATDDRRPLKTRASRRLVPFGNSVLEVMSEELRENPVDTSNESVFRSARGLLWTSGTISNTFLRLREHLGLDEHVTFKSLRHFYASTLIASGASVTMVAEYLGHASPAITLEVYAHLWPGDDDRARQAVDAVALLSDDGAGPVRDRAGRLALA